MERIDRYEPPEVLGRLGSRSKMNWMMLEIYQSQIEGEFPEYLVDPKDPFNPDAGQQMIESFDSFWHQAKTWTERHAMEDIEP